MTHKSLVVNSATVKFNRLKVALMPTHRPTSTKWKTALYIQIFVPSWQSWSLRWLVYLLLLYSGPLSYLTWYVFPGRHVVLYKQYRFLSGIQSIKAGKLFHVNQNAHASRVEPILKQRYSCATSLLQSATKWSVMKLSMTRDVFLAHTSSFIHAYVFWTKISMRIIRVTRYLEKVTNCWDSFGPGLKSLF